MLNSLAMRFALPIVMLWLFTMPQDQPNSWRGLTPLHSTCDDVKKVLGITECSEPRTEYKDSEWRVTIEFAQGCDKEGKGLRLPKGTVAAIIVTPQTPMTPSQFGYDISKYEKREDGEIIGIEHYTNNEDGVWFDMYKGYIMHIILVARKADEGMRCKPPKQKRGKNSSGGLVSTAGLPLSFHASRQETLASAGRDQ